MAKMEENMKFCNLCSLALHNDHDAMLHYKGKKHKAVLDHEEARKRLETTSVFVFGFKPNSLTKSDIFAYFDANFGKVAEVLVKEDQMSSAIVEFVDAKVAQEVLRVKKFKIDGQAFVAHPRVVPKKEKKKSEVIPAVHNLRIDVSSFPIRNEEDFQVLYQSVRITEEDEQHNRSVVKEVEKILQIFIENKFTVQLFGSSANGFGWKNGDLDMTVVFDTRTNADAKNRNFDEMIEADVNQFMDEKRLTCNEVQSLPPLDCLKLFEKFLSTSPTIKQTRCVKGSRVPVLKFHVHGKFWCDLSLNNRLAVNNTKWLKFLADGFPTLPVLATSFRFWAIKRGVTAELARHFQFSGYQLNLMLITFLQSKNVLPTVVALDDGSEAGLVDGWKCNWKEIDFANYSQENIFFDHLKEFFELISSKNLRNLVFVPRTGSFLTLKHFIAEYSKSAEAMHNDRPKFVFSELNVQDPFVLNHNICEKITIPMVEELKRSASTVASAGLMGNSLVDSLNVCFQTEIGKSANSDNLVEMSDELNCSVEMRFAPSLNDWNRFVWEWGQNFDTIWLEKTSTCIKRMLSDVFLLDVHVNDEQQTFGESASKRMKLDEDEKKISEIGMKIRCAAKVVTWRGRKQARKNEDLTTMDDEFEVEKKISTQIVNNNVASQDSSTPHPSLEFWLEMEKCEADEESSLNLKFSCAEPVDRKKVNEMREFCTCFNSTLPKVLVCWMKRM